MLSCFQHLRFLIKTVFSENKGSNPVSKRQLLHFVLLLGLNKNPQPQRPLVELFSHTWATYTVQQYSSGDKSSDNGPGEVGWNDGGF